jgi:HEPN domain-containing protein
MKQAKRDLENAEYELKGEFYEWACFLSQQSAEKAVKAVFQKLGGEAFGHSVAGLLQELSSNLKPGREILNMAKELDKAYIPTRYPNVHPKGSPFEVYTEEEARRLIGYARKIIEYCESILPKI